LSVLALVAALTGAAPRADAARRPPVAAPRCGAPGEPGATVTRTVDVHGVRRTYLVAVPASGAPTAPILLAFHGYSSHAYGLADASRLAPVMTARGFVVVFPEGSGDPTRWTIPGHLQGADDDAFVDALVTDLTSRRCGDPTRLYGAGFSNGAAYLGHLACVRPGRFRGLAFVGGAGFVGGCAPSRVPATTPVVLVHGRADVTVPITGGQVLGGALQAEPFVRAVTRWRTGRRTVVARIVPGWGHTWPALATREIVATFAA
jgi:polyhydroxybutyrate depolymerase